MKAPTESATSRRILHLRTVGLALVLLAPPLVAEPQQPTKVFRIVELNPTPAPQEQQRVFRQALRELGYVQGENILIDDRFAAGNEDRLREHAAEAVSLKVDLIFAVSSSAVRAATNATKTIPIVGLDLESDPVPRVSRVGVLANPASPATARRLKELEGAARALRVKLHVLEAPERQQIDNAFAAMTRERAEALLVMTDPMFFAQRERIVDLATKNRLPGIFERREFAEAGGLLSYGTNLADMYRRLATYVDKILKGAKPGDLPVEQPTKFELVVNLKTAKALGLSVPQSLLLRADQVIE